MQEHERQARPPAHELTRSWWLRITLVLGVALLVSLIVWGQHQARQPQPPLPLVALRVGAHALHAEVATTLAAQKRGLMFRTALAEDAGMLFVYDTDQELAFWMLNTSIPLSLAFLDAHGRIVQFADMAPFDDTIHRSATLARYALEVNQGWFARHGVRVGDQIVMAPEREVEH
jgi:uncharacterized membrane protein (UPF0127 family)